MPIRAVEQAPPAPESPQNPLATFRADANFVEVDAVIENLKIFGYWNSRTSLEPQIALSSGLPLEERSRSTDYLGSSIGRYANRIAGAGFPLDGRPVASSSGGAVNST